MAMLPADTLVEVRAAFDGAWHDGFQVVEVLDTPLAAYRLRRRSDRFVLPRIFLPQEVRRQRPGEPGVRPRRRLLV